MIKIYPGWFILLGLCFVYAASNGLMLNSLPLFYPSLIDEFGWNAEEVTGPASLSFFATAFLSLFVGYLVDRFSPKVMMIIGSVLYVLFLFLYSLIDTIQEMTIIYLGLSLALALNGLLPSMVVLSKWFQNKRGLAVGVLLMSSSLGGAILPLFIGPLLISEGWRVTAVLISILGFVMMVIPCIFLIRNSPLKNQLEKNSNDRMNINHKDDVNQTGVMSEINLFLLFKTPIFYLLAFSTGVMWFCIAGVVQHQSIYIGTDLNLTSHLSTVFSVFFFSSVIGKVLFGYLSDHFEKINIMILATFNLMVGLLFFRFLDGDSLILLYSYAVIYGIGFSGAFTMIQLIIAELFAGPSYGKILGLYVFIDTLAGGVGVAVLGRLRVLYDNYLFSINLMIGLCIGSLLCVMLIKQIIQSKRFVHSI